jgi:hypothetical protein
MTLPSTPNAEMVGGRIFVRDISRCHKRQRCPGFDIRNRIPAIFHTLFVGSFGHDIPEGLVRARPVLLEQSCPHIVPEPVAYVILFGGVLDQSYTLVIIVEPIHL